MILYHLHYHQGGNYSRHNLYVEVMDTIKKNGYLHKGMKKLLESLVLKT